MSAPVVRDINALLHEYNRLGMLVQCRPDDMDRFYAHMEALQVLLEIRSEISAVIQRSSRLMLPIQEAHAKRLRKKVKAERHQLELKPKP